MIVPVPQFTNPSYNDRTLNEIQKCVNLYPEKTANGYVLNSFSGLDRLATVTNNAACRGMISVTGSIYNTFFSVHGNKVYGLTTSGTVYDTWTISSSSGNVSMAYSQTELLIVDGSAGYIINLAASTITAIVDAQFPTGARSCIFLNSRFFVNNHLSENFYMSDLNNGLSWTSLNVASAQSTPDPLVGIATDTQNIYFMGFANIEIWYFTNGTTFPYERINGATIPIGILTSTCYYMLDKTLFVFAIGQNGGAGLYEIRGADYKLVSTPEVNRHLMENYVQHSDIVVNAFIDRGQTFCTIASLSVPVSWCYNVSQNSWFELSSIYASANYMAKFIVAAYSTNSINYCYASDWSNGNIYSLRHITNTDNDNTTTRTRIFGPIESGTKKVFHAEIRIEAEIKLDVTGTTSVSPTLEWTDDDGLTYSTAVTMTQTITNSTTGQRVLFTNNRMGSSARRYYRLIFVGPAAKITLLRCELDLREGRF